MKFLLRVIVFFWYSILPFSFIAAPDCLDNSWHMQQENDLKNYHPVSCTCPCGMFTPNEQYRLLKDRNQCFTCKHYHDTRNLPIKRSSALTQYTLGAHILHYIKKSTVHPDGQRLHTLFSAKNNQVSAYRNKN